MLVQTSSLSDRMDRAVSAILPSIAATLAERTSKGPAKIDLATAENWLIRPELVALCKEAIARDLAAESFSYPQGFGGEPSLLAALARFFNTYFNPSVPVLPTHIVATPGASSCLDTLFYTICDAGDSVLVPAPYWNGFDFHMTIRSGINLIPVSTPTLAETLTSALIPALTAAYESAPNSARVKALLFTNPHNPFARCYPADVVRGCMRFCQERNLHFVSDEVYAMSEHKGEEEVGEGFVSALGIRDVIGEADRDMKEPLGRELIDPSRVHIIWSLSKDFGSSGIRMACLISQSNQAVQTGLAMLSTTQLSSLTTIATTSLLNSPNLATLISLNSQRLAESYKLVTAVLRRQKIEYVPANAGLYVFARLAGDAAGEGSVVKALGEKGVLVSAGKGFHLGDGDRGWVRINFAVERKVLLDGIEMVNRFLENGHDSIIRTQ